MQFSGDIGTTGLDSNDSHGRRQRQIEVPHASKKKLGTNSFFKNVNEV